MRIRPDTNMQETKKKGKEKRMLSVQNISDAAVTIKFDQGHQNWHENSTFTGDYPKAEISPKICSRRTQNKSFRRIRNVVINYLPSLNVCQTHGKQFAVIPL